MFTWLSLVMSMMVSFLLSFFPRDVLDEILNLIQSVSGGFPTYSLSDGKVPGSGPEVMKLFSCSTQLSIKF